MRDDDNPKYVFQTTTTECLLNILSSHDPYQLIADEMAARGLDVNGKWVGFDDAKEQWAKWNEIRLDATSHYKFTNP